MLSQHFLDENASLDFFQRHWGKACILFVSSLLFASHYLVIFQILPEAFPISSLPFILIASFFEILFWTMSLSYFQAVFSNPGFIPQIPKPIDLPPMHQEHCKFCHQWKPARAHHCQKCRKCVFLMDHHCDWINNCVGFGNLKFFLIFCHTATFYCTFCLFLEFICTPFIMIRNNQFLPTSSKAIVLLTSCLTLSLFGAMFPFLSWTFAEDMKKVLKFNQSGVEEIQQKCGRVKSFKENCRLILGTNEYLWFLPIRQKSKMSLIDSWYPPNSTEKESKPFTMIERVTQQSNWEAEASRHG